MSYCLYIRNDERIQSIKILTRISPLIFNQTVFTTLHISFLGLKRKCCLFLTVNELAYTFLVPTISDLVRSQLV